MATRDLVPTLGEELAMSLDEPGLSAGSCPSGSCRSLVLSNPATIDRRIPSHEVRTSLVTRDAGLREPCGSPDPLSLDAHVLPTPEVLLKHDPVERAVGAHPPGKVAGTRHAALDCQVPLDGTEVAQFERDTGRVSERVRTVGGSPDG